MSTFTFWENFVKLCNYKGVKPNPAAAEMGISSGSVTGWKKGVRPTDTNLIKIANYFGVDKDILLSEGDIISEIKNSDIKENNVSTEYYGSEMKELKNTISEKDAEIKRLNKLLDLTLKSQEQLEKYIETLKAQGLIPRD